MRSFLAGFALIFGLGALAFLLIGVLGLASGHVVAGGALIGAAVVVAGLSWLSARLTRRGGRALTMKVCPEAITMSRLHGEGDTIRRHEIGLVLIRTAGRAGVISVEVYGPDRKLVGSWDPNWGRPAGPVRLMRALRRLDYPWAAHDMMALFWRDKFRSKVAPSWTEEIARP